jgi:hypothetical protein
MPPNPHLNLSAEKLLQGLTKLEEDKDVEPLQQNQLTITCVGDD